MAQFLYDLVTVVATPILGTDYYHQHVRTITELIKAEKKSWVLPHDLNIDDAVNREQDSKINKFGETLFLCHEDMYLFAKIYRHWFVTDRRWTIEFGRGELQHATVYVHNDQKSTYHIAEKFSNTEDVRARMKKVCGATNYSLALRNCEHVARYIYCGVWACFQMTGGGKLRQLFRTEMGKSSKMVNTYPIELVPKPATMVTLHPDETNFIRWTKTLHILTAAEDKMFNILFLGPTGCGKSTLINQMYNMNVCMAKGGVTSVTKDIHFIQGTYSVPTIKIKGQLTDRDVKVNVIDTIGMCDSVLTANEVIALVRKAVKINLDHIDKVIICCSGRLELGHKNSILKFMKWLRYQDFKENFAFFYTKTDGMPNDEKQNNLLKICDLLNIDSQVSILRKEEDTIVEEEVTVVNTISFAPNATSDEISMSRNKLMTVAFMSPSSNVGSRRRIPVPGDTCTIL